MQQSSIVTCEDGVYRSSRTEVTICGELTPSALSRFLSEVRGDDHRLVITSSGGISSSAIRLVREVNKRKMEIVVKGFCLSACAHFVFMGADDVKLEPYSLVAFHHTSSFIYEVLLKKGSVKQAEGLKRERALEREFYTERNISLSFLIEPELALGPLCVALGRRRLIDEPKVFTALSLFVPLRADIERLRGREFSGFWPSSFTDIRRVGNHLAISVRQLIGMGHLQKSNEAAMDIALNAIPLCLSEDP